MSRLPQLSCLLAMLLLGALIVWAEPPDTHVTNDPLRQLYQCSAYAHGYIHGYQRGFHEADLDIHMGHAPRALAQVKSYRTDDYRGDYGNHGFYHLGYQQGFRAAYADAMRGGSFRALETLRGVAERLNAPPRSGEFDQAFSAGYDGGYTEAQQTSGDIHNVAAHCLPGGGRSAAYCDAYARGYRVGHADGAANPQHTQTAEKK